MAKQSSTPATDAELPQDSPRDAPLSLNRLREAFAAMLGGSATANNESRVESKKQGAGAAAKIRAPAPRDLPCEINPRSVAEAMLFVGRPDQGSWSSRELAAAMRGVSPGEIDAAVCELNAQYDADAAPYYIEQSGGGYRLILRPQFERMRDKFYGRVKEARLSPAALEVLSVLAYNQPATVEQLNELRGAPCGSAISTLVRRRLVRLERAADAGKVARYLTTERFLQLFGLESLAALPRSEELEKV